MLTSMEARLALMTHMEMCDQEVQQELAIYKATILARVMASHEAPMVKVPKPQVFNDKRDAKEFDNFLWKMEWCFEAISLRDEIAKVRITTLYLIDTATLW